MDDRNNLTDEKIKFDDVGEDEDDDDDDNDDEYGLDVSDEGDDENFNGYHR